MRNDIVCDLIELYGFLGKKWTVALFHNITDEPVSFNELERLTKGLISPILLSSRLKKMIDFKLIDKKMIDGRPVYQITSEGKKLKDIMHNIKDWAIECNYDLPDICKKKKCFCDYVFDVSKRNFK